MLKRREHHVPLPKWFMYLRATQFLFAIICAGCAAYVTKELPWFETSDLMIFTVYNPYRSSFYLLVANVQFKGFASVAFALYFILGTFVLQLI